VRTIALQLYTVRHALAQNAGETLRQVWNAGYRAVETAPLPPELTPRRLGLLLRELGLSVTAAHGDLPLGDRRFEVVDAAAELGATRLIWHGWPRDSACQSMDGFRRLAEDYTEASRVARKHGLQFGIHNHWWEFEQIEGTYPYQLLNQLLPLDVFIELDVYWAQTAGVDPVRVLHELGDRVTMLHVKDGPALHGQPMTALGDGRVDVLKVVGAAHRSASLVVELDECATDPMDAARRSLEFLSQIR
jgi:sugar phosphate isomerase/epimerase